MSEKEYAKVIAKNLRNIAYNAGKTQADIAKDLNISKATVSSWMNGTRIPRMDKIDLLCHYFNVTRTSIMETETDPRVLQVKFDIKPYSKLLKWIEETEAEGLSEVLEAYCEFNEQDRNEVLSLVRMKMQKYK